MSQVSQYEEELVVLLLRDSYGDLMAEVVEALIQHGRLTLPLLSRYLHRRSTTTLQRVLVALIQNRFVQYWSGEDDDGESQQTAYVAATRIIYNTLVRAGSIVTFTSDSFPDLVGAPEVVKNLLLYGHIRAADYLASAGTSTAAASARAAVTTLLQRKILRTLRKHDFQPESDNYMRIFRRRLANIPRTNTLSEAKRDAQAHDETKAEFSVLLHLHDDVNDGLIKKHSASSSHHKKSRSNDAQAAETVVNESAVLAVNHDKFIVHMRAQLLTQLVAQRIGNVTAAVYKQVLDCMDAKIFRCQPHTSVTVSSLEVSRALNSEVNLACAIVSMSNRKRSRSRSRSQSHSSSRSAKRVKRSKHSDDGDDSDSSRDNSMSDDSTRRSKKKKKPQIVSSNSESGSGSNSNAHSDSEESEDSEDEAGSNSRIEHVNLHLSLLALSQTMPFLTRIGSKGGGEWTIDFNVLSARARELEYESFIRRKFGNIAVRLLRIVRQHGRIDEKQLAQLALLPAKDIRSHLMAMHEIGALDLQEVPRGADRAPSKTFYLWFHKPESAYALMVQALLRTMARCYSRIIEERTRRPGIMSKLMRSDMQGDEGEATLTAAEKDEIKRVRNAELRLFSQITRLDKLVVVFRDM
ncbi:RNA polymerase III subunit RPC82-domain-containing protein [Limtongia smithiae]|uniref:RNA polymerase III subunit RPC82-domain-containing protein n=1 Tax=Limtongia smithiae TaxID=1125753 RepID=UPI0034CDDA2A